MLDISPHEWYHSRLSSLMAEAQQAGIARDVSVAVITDLVNGPDFGVAVPKPDEQWNEDIGEPDYLIHPNSLAGGDQAGEEDRENEAGRLSHLIGNGHRGNRKF